ncbi:MAG: hypothetical protein NDJ24_04335 [Alphaproteobacteria bacterium]|nr:hypothetical protein [Alphaproteobacteria bacterium]
MPARKGLRVTQDKTLTFQLQPMPADTATDNRISAGWLLSEMDKASGRRAHEYIYAGDKTHQGRTVTAGIDAMVFKKPLFVGDLVKIYTEVARQGRSSVTIKTEVWADRRDSKAVEMVTEGLFTFVAIDAQRKPVPILTNNTSQNPVLVPPGTARKAGVVINQSMTPVGNPVLTLTPDRRNTNALGDIFGGWILSRMDDAAAGSAAQITGGHRVANVALDAMTFHRPVLVNDEVTFYTALSRLGKSSVAINIEAWAKRSVSGLHEKVTEGLFTYVAVDNNLKPIPITTPPVP